MLTFDLVIAMLFVSGISMAGLGLYGKQYVGRIPAATPYVLLMFTAGAWAILYALDLLAPTLALKVFYHDLRFLFLPFFPALELWLVVVYVRHPEWLDRKRAAAILAIPVLAVILALTSPYHGLFRYNFSMNTTGPVPFLQYSESAFFTFYSLYSLALLVIALGILVIMTWRTGTLRETRTILLLLALSVPTALNYLFQAGITPVIGVNPAPVLLWVTAIMYTVALFRFQLLDMVPVARNRLIETMSFPVVVLDNEGKVVDLNPAARSFFSAPGQPVYGRNIGEIAPDWPEFISFCRSGGTQRADLAWHHAGTERYYSVSTEPIITRYGESDGEIILIQDVTPEKTAERALRESENRFRQLADVTLEGIIIHKAGIIRDLNERACEMAGYRREELLGQDVLMLAAPGFRETVRGNIASGYDRPYEVQLLRKDSSVVWVDVRAHQFISGGETLRIATLWDITERRASDAALRESGEKFRALVETTNDFIWEVDRDGRYTYASPRVREMLGYGPEELLGRTPFQFMPPGEAERVAAEFTRLVRQRLPISALENRCLHRDGSVVVLETSGVPRYSKDGSFEGYRGIDRDITVRTRALEALREKTEELDQYFTTSLDLFCIADTGGFFRRLNREWEHTLGYTLDELEGRRFLDFVHPDDMASTLSAIADLSSQQEVLNFTNRYRRKDGTYRWIEWRSTPKGNLIFAAARDITERKRAETALAEAEEKYRTIIDNMQDIFYRTDLDGKITMISPSAEKLAGYSPGQLIGTDVLEVYADPAERTQFLRELGAKGAVYAYPLTLKLRDGSVRYVTTSSHFFRGPDGTVQGVEGVIHDVTELRRAEDGLRSANRKLNLLSGITRHDIRNQLMVLQGYLELSKESPGDAAKVAEYVARQERAVQAIDRQIAFTKEYQDLGVEAPAWQNVRECIGKATAVLPVGGIHVDDGPRGLEVYADPMLEKVFYNLLDNSLRYGGEGMTGIRITASGGGNDPLRLVFEDDGAGISAEDKPRLFTRGFGKNTGLGLFLSREILSITGITITENGIPGQGARFEITVPAGMYRFVE